METEDVVMDEEDYNLCVGKQESVLIKQEQTNSQILDMLSDEEGGFAEPEDVDELNRIIGKVGPEQDIEEILNPQI